VRQVPQSPPVCRMRAWSLAINLMSWLGGLGLARRRRRKLPEKKLSFFCFAKERHSFFFATGTGARSGPTSSASRRDNHLDISAPVSRNKGSSASESAESPIVMRACRHRRRKLPAKNCVVLLLRKRMTQFFLWVNPTGTGARSGPISSASRRDNHLDISAPVSRNKGSSASESAESPIVTRACRASETARKKTVSFGLTPNPQKNDTVFY